MADAEEKAKAEKLAAAKKRVEQLKKKKTAGKVVSKKEAPTTPDIVEQQGEPSPSLQEDERVDESAVTGEDDNGVQATKDAEDTVSELARSSSVTQQSRLRSSSFRQSSGGLPSPGYGFPTDGDTAPAIYQKQALKIDELEKENKRLAKETADSEKRWKKAEEELEDLREVESPLLLTKSSSKIPPVETSEEIEKLRTEIAGLQRQNTQLQAQTSRRHGSSPSMSTPSPSDMEAALASKDSTIESMEFEISNLRAQMERVASGSSSEKEQVFALEEKLARIERQYATSERELGDLKKNLQRTTEKAIKEGSERTSAETKLRTLERDLEAANAHSQELQKKVEALEKKTTTLATLHKEHDARSQAQKREREKLDKEASDLRARFAGIENENLRLKEERERLKKRDAQGADDEGVDELENEERQRLEKRVRELEGEVHELRRGVWRERRKELEGDDTSAVGFSDVDLGSVSPNRRRSIPAGGKGLGDFLTSGFNAITGAASVNDGLLDEDDGLDFDEDAFRLAQEDEAKKRIERVKDIKRGLKKWEGWRLDLVENRRGGGEGVGEIFEV